MKNFVKVMILVIIAICALFPSVALTVSETPKDVIILIDTSVSMHHDCTNPEHNYYLTGVSSVLTNTAYSYDHYSFTTDASDVINSVTAQKPSNGTYCDDRLRIAKETAKAMIEEIYAVNADNRVAVVGFNASLVTYTLAADGSITFYNNIEKQLARVAVENTTSTSNPARYGGPTNYKTVLEALKVKLDTQGISSTSDTAVVVISDGMPSGNDRGQDRSDYIVYPTYDTSSIVSTLSADPYNIDFITIGVGATAQADGVAFYNSLSKTTTDIPPTLLSIDTALEKIGPLGRPVTVYNRGTNSMSVQLPANVKEYFEIASQPVFTTNLSSSAAFSVGSALELKATATGEYGTLSYQWYKDGAIISGAILDTFSVTSASEADSGIYKLVVTNTSGDKSLSTTSVECTVSVNSADAPVFTTNLLPNATVTMNDDYTLTVAASATYSDSLTYKWYKDDVEIAGAVSTSYSITSAAAASDEGVYKVVVTNNYGTSSAETTSVECSLDVTDSPYTPVITTQPQSVDASEISGAITLSVTATAEGGTPTYQWYKDSAEISGATSDSYTISSPDPVLDEGSYYVTVTNNVGGEDYTVVSDTASISFGTYYDILVLVDTSKSMMYDCENPEHNYMTGTVKTENLLTWNTYQHYVVSKDDDGNIVVSSSAAKTPVESCNERLHQAQHAANDIIDAVLKVGNYNRVAVSGFNTVLTTPSFSFGTDASAAQNAIETLAARYAGATNYTTMLTSTQLRLNTNGVVREGAQKVIILISDGCPSTNEVGNDSSAAATYNGVEKAAELAAAGVDIFALGVGETVTPMQFYQYNGTTSSMSALLAKTAPLSAIGDYDVAATWNNVREYFEMTEAPEISVDLSGERVGTLGEETTLSISATSPDEGTLSYQWYKDGSEISGATSSSYTFVATESLDGAEYSVKITNTKKDISASIMSGVVRLVVASEQPLDVLLLIDTSKSMAYDCQDEDHSYLSSSVILANNIPNPNSTNTYRHYIVSQDANGNVVITESAIVNPDASCNERLTQAKVAANDIIDSILAQNPYNRVAVSGFNSVLMNTTFAFGSDGTAAHNAVGSLPSEYQGATCYTNVFDGTTTRDGVVDRLNTDGVTREGAQTLIILISDGCPSSNDISTTLASLSNYNGIASADALKASGVDILTLGVGDTVNPMRFLLADGSYSAPMTTFLARTDTLEALGSYDSAKTWNNVRAYLGLPTIPTITKDLDDELIGIVGESTILTVTGVTNYGGAISYKWYKNGDEISGETSNSLTIENVTSAMDGDVYKAEIINTLEGKTASAVTNVGTLIVSETQPLDILILIDTSKSMMYDCEDPDYSYQTQSQYDILSPSYKFDQYRLGLLKIVSGSTVTDADPSQNYFIKDGLGLRLQDAAESAKEIVELAFSSNQNNRVAISGFRDVLTNDSFDFDYSTSAGVSGAVDDLLDSWDAYKGPTNYTTVLDAAHARIDSDGITREGAKTIVVIISDGCPSTNDVGNDKSTDAEYNGIASAEALREDNVDVYTVGVGNTLFAMRFYQPSGAISTMSALLAKDSTLEALGSYSDSYDLNNLRILLNLPEKNAVDANDYRGIPDEEVNVLIMIDTSKSMQYDCQNPYYSYQTSSQYERLSSPYDFDLYRIGRIRVSAGKYLTVVNPNNLWGIDESCYTRLQEAGEYANEIAKKIISDNPEANIAITDFRDVLLDKMFSFDIKTVGAAEIAIEDAVAGYNAYKGPTNYTTVLTQVRERLEVAGNQDIPTVIIMLSDGMPSTNEVGNDRTGDLGYNGVEIASQLKEEGVKFYTLTVGNTSKSMHFYTPSGLNAVNMDTLRATSKVLKQLGTYTQAYNWQTKIYMEGSDPGPYGSSKRGSGTYIDAFAGAGGSITREGRTRYSRGKTATYTITPDNGWMVYKVIAMPAYSDPGTEIIELEVDDNNQVKINADTSYVIRAFFTRSGFVIPDMEEYDKENIINTVVLPDGPLDVVFFIDTSKSMWYDCQNPNYNYMTKNQYTRFDPERWYDLSNYAHGQVVQQGEFTLVDADPFFGYYVDETCQNRLQDAALLTNELIAKVLSDDNNRVAISGFRDVLTTDQYSFDLNITKNKAHSIIKGMINPYSPNAYKGPTNYTKTLADLKDTILKDTRNEATKVIVMISDGIPSTNEIGNNSASNVDYNGMSIADELKKDGVVIITISVGELQDAMKFYQPDGARSTMTALCANDMLLRMLSSQYYDGEALLHPEVEKEVVIEVEDVPEVEEEVVTEDETIEPTTVEIADKRDLRWLLWSVIAAGVILLGLIGWQIVRKIIMSKNDNHN